jgi:hypothetical protein
MRDARHPRDGADLYNKILSFLAAECARKNGRQCIGVDLLYAPGGDFQDEEIRTWTREDEPDLFDIFVNVETLVTQILKIAEQEADAKPEGKHRFVVRTHQHMGGRANLSFRLSPRYVGKKPAQPSDDDLRLRIVLATLTGAAATRPENGSFAAHHEQLVANAFDLADGVLKMLALENKKASQGAPRERPVDLIAEFGRSLRVDQLSTLVGVFTMEQKLLFLELMRAPSEGADA